MINLALKKEFSALAAEDHLTRLRLLLGDLEGGQTDRQKEQFDSQLSQCVQKLADSGLTSPYQQACMLFCLFRGGLVQEFILHEVNVACWLEPLIKQAWQDEKSIAAFQLLHSSFAGLVHHELPWIDPNPQAFFQGLPHPWQQPANIQLACMQSGPVDQGWESAVPGCANHFRASTGFQHPVGGQLTPVALVQQVCRQVLAPEAKRVYLRPVVAYCEFGVMANGRFHVLQPFELIDQQLLLGRMEGTELSCPAEDIQQLQGRWQGVRFFSESLAHIAQPIAVGAGRCQAGWLKAQDSYQYILEGSISLAVPSSALVLQAGFLHEGVWVELAIECRQGVKLEWSFREAWAEGSLPVGRLFVLQQHVEPLSVALSPVVRVNSPVLNAVRSTAGQLQFTLQGTIQPDTLVLQLDLVLSHSRLACDWQSHDVVRGVRKGAWILLEQAEISRWSLLSG